MVYNKARSRVIFFMFVFPALAFYFIFALIPLFEGIWLSTMNWDGVAPWTPASMSIPDFENQILNKIKNKNDKALLLKYYQKNEDQGTYQKQELYGFDRYRVQFIIAATGYINSNFKFIGFKNYINLFNKNANPRFFPEIYIEKKFQIGSPLEDAMSIPETEWNNNLIKHVKDSKQIELLKEVYKKENNFYILNKDKFKTNDTDLQLEIANIPGFENDWEKLYQDISNLGIDGKENEIEKTISSVPSISEGKIKSMDLDTIKTVSKQVYETNYLKGILSNNWIKERFKMGVILFTIFFTIFNVFFVNMLAIFLAIGLDTKIKTRNILRSVYFIPNVLSMIIVSFIWQLIFTQLIPKITGIDRWIMNPDLAPWICVLVAVWQGLGYYTIIYLAGLQSISLDIMEVAAIDGIPRFSKFFYIILPLLVPAITICLFLSLSGSLKTFDIIFALYPSNSTSIGVDNLTINIFYDATRDRQASLATAKAIILLTVIMLITGIQLYFSKRKEVEL